MQGGHPHGLVRGGGFQAGDNGPVGLNTCSDNEFRCSDAERRKKCGVVWVFSGAAKLVAVAQWFYRLLRPREGR